MKIQPISKTHEELGAKLSQYKIEHHLSILEMAKVFGIHHVKLSRILNGTQEITLSEYIQIKDVILSSSARFYRGEEQCQLKNKKN